MGDFKSYLDFTEIDTRPLTASVDYKEFLSVLRSLEVNSTDPSLKRFVKQLESKANNFAGGKPPGPNEIREYRPKGFPSCAILTYLMNRGESIKSHREILFTIPWHNITLTTLPVPATLPVIWKSNDQVNVTETVTSLMKYVTPVVENVPTTEDYMLTYLGLEVLPVAVIETVNIVETLPATVFLSKALIRSKPKRKHYPDMVATFVAKTRKRSKKRVRHGRAKFTVDYISIFALDPVIPFTVDSPG